MTLPHILARVLETARTCPNLELGPEDVAECAVEIVLDDIGDALTAEQAERLRKPLEDLVTEALLAGVVLVDRPAVSS